MAVTNLQMQNASIVLPICITLAFLCIPLQGTCSTKVKILIKPCNLKDD